MISKKPRQARILDLIREQEVSSQEALAHLLERSGVAVTQSTLSRDIRDLGLVKVRGRYCVSTEVRPAPAADNLKRTFQQMVVASGISGNILMLRTAPGHGHSLGVALDAARWPEIMGTVAGDDTVFALLRSSKLGRKLIRRIEGLLL